jgi:hypothetical protein
MLRRYLIVNFVTTAFAYAAYFAFMPSGVGIAAHLSDSIRNASMESPMLAPLVHRIITVSGLF